MKWFFLIDIQYNFIFLNSRLNLFVDRISITRIWKFSIKYLMFLSIEKRKQGLNKIDFIVEHEFLDEIINWIISFITEEK